MDVDIYYQAPKDLMSCTGVIGKDGTEYPLDVYDKVIFTHMMDKYKQWNGNHWETQDTIAGHFNLDVRQAAKALKQLVKCGLVQAKKERNHSISPHLSWYYTGVDTSLQTYKIDRVSRTTRESRSKKVIDSEINSAKIFTSEIELEEWM